MEKNHPNPIHALFPGWQSLLLLVLFVIVFSVFDRPSQTPKKGDFQKEHAVILPPFRAPDVPVPVINAESFLVFDIQTGKKIFGKNEHVALPLASLTKLMTTLTASRIFAKNTSINPASVLSSDEPFLNVLWNFKTLASYTLTVSSNPGAAVIAGVAGHTLSGTGESFVEKMNMLGQSLGLSETYFINASGLDDSGALNGGYGSASDMALLLRAAQKEIPDIMSVTAKTESDFQSESGSWFHAMNTNQAIHDIPGLIAGKTGYTEIAGGNLAILFDADVGHPVAIVVLGSSKEGRFQDVSQLVQSTLRVVHNR